MVEPLPGQRNVTLFADFLLGVATARHHSTKSQTAGAEGAAAVLTAQLRGQGNHIVYFSYNVSCVSMVQN